MLNRESVNLFHGTYVHINPIVEITSSFEIFNKLQHSRRPQALPAQQDQKRVMGPNGRWQQAKTCTAGPKGLNT